MLQELNIKNIALIKELTIAFEEGLNVLSGETGAGKSIVVDSVSLILGERGFKELIRSGEEKAFVEAFVTIEDASAMEELFEECGIESCDEMIVARELTASGKNTCRINGRMVPLGMLKRIMAKLINLHGQNQHQDIFDKKLQLDMLDSYAFAEDDSALKDMKSIYADYRKAETALAKICSDEKERERRMDVFSYQLNEIAAAKLEIGEEDALEAERDVIRNAEKIAYALNGAHMLLSESEGIRERLSAAAKMLSGVAEYNEKYAQLESVLRDAYYNLEEADYDLASLAEDTVFDEQRLDEIEERLSLISDLKRKYGSSIEEILQFAEETQQQYEVLQ
ncbi:MAG: AAA family ATPase, partial [Christensenellaceae bacterium]|nr:AAA family ATPase [Christensenellaceae bacterium]